MSKRSTRSTKAPTKTSPDAEITHSIVVPAYKEKANLRPLTTRLFAAFEDTESPISAESVELIVVDDNSRDGSVEEVDALREEGYNIRIVVRTNERGLTSAVARGFKEAKGEAMICMDADLQVKNMMFEKGTLTGLASSRVGAEDVGFHYGAKTFRARDKIRTWR